MTKRDLVAISADVREHMAKAFFASAYADQWEESADATLNPSGCDWMDLTPDETDPAALRAATELERRFLADNPQFTCLAGALDWLQTVAPEGGDRDRTAEMLGHYLAMQAMGHGVGLYDAFGDAVHDALRVPYLEFSSLSLDRDYFAMAGA